MIISTVGKAIEGQQLAVITPQASAREASKMMCELDVGALAVVDGEMLVGVISERDVIRKCVCADRHTSETLVSEIMTADPKTLEPRGNLAQALEIMGEGGFHHLPVVDGGKVVGVLSLDDIPEEYRMMLERFKEMREG